MASQHPARPPATAPDERLRCPKDATIMERVPVGSFVVDRCAGCGALWFDALELRRVLESKAAIEHLDVGAMDTRPVNTSLGTPLGGILCPRDRTPLLRAADLKQQHIVVDGCPTCGGVMLDSGELKDLSEHTISEKIRGLFKGRS